MASALTDRRGQAGRPLLSVRELTVRFHTGGGELKAVDGVSFDVHAGRTIAIVGESGAGKTLACRALLGLHPERAAVTGSVELDGRELIGLGDSELRRHRGRDIALVFQDAERALNPAMCIGRQIAEAVRIHERCGKRAAAARACELLSLLEIGEARERFFAYPHELSGGMRQRVMLATALAAEPKLLIADEATRSLDVTTQARILALLESLRHRLGMALILICHDLRIATAFADEVLVMHAGRVVEHAAPSSLLASPRSSYAKALLGAVTRLEARPGRKPVRSEPLLAAREIVQRFSAAGRASLRPDRRIVHAVRGVSLEIAAGETLGLVGETGSGKSSFARTLFQAPAPASGSVWFRGEELTRLRGRKLAEHRRGMQMVFQDPVSSLDPAWTISSIVAEPLAALGRGERRRKAAELLDLVGLSDTVYGRRRARELSGGQCQRVAIARALASDPVLLVCDEALSSLDALIQAHMLDLFERLRARLGLAYLFISHDLSVVRRISDRIAVMYAGRLCEIGPADDVCRSALHPYTAALLASAPSGLASKARAAGRPARDVIGGDRPSPVVPPAGCAFRARCPRARDLCAIETPSMRGAGDEHQVACHFPSPLDRAGTVRPPTARRC